MTLKELLSVTSRDTLICVCDNMGPFHDTVELSEVPLVSLMEDLDREVDRIYIDRDDHSLTVELKDVNPLN